MDRPVRILGVPMDLGADRRGVDMGPSAIRYGGLARQLGAVDVACTDDGDVTVPRPEGRNPEIGAFGDRARYIEETRTVCVRVADRVGDIREDGAVPLVLGGDHSIAIGTVSGIATEPTGVLWFDAHGDFNTPETTPSGNVHGMSLAAILGLGPFADMEWARAPAVPASNVAIVGVRSLDERERQVVAASDVTAYTMTDIDRRGITAVVSDAVDVATSGVDQLHVSFDLDWLDPSEAPGVGTPVRGGATYREAHAALECVHSEANTSVAALELVEVNPILDEHNRTAELACELAGSVFGDTTLP